MLLIRVILLVFSGPICTRCFEYLKFPEGFKFGAGSSAYQVEGAWNVSDKGMSVWDGYTHAVPSAIADGSDGDVACDSYHQWRRDVEMASELGLHFYRFSISWPRLLPLGFSNRVSADGAQYYSDLIDELLRHGIEPVVTIFHWDLPQVLDDLGGWANPKIVEWFEDYARVVYSLYADRVKTWITINEPNVVCDYFYNSRLSAPALVDTQMIAYICNKNILLAHARSWRLYDVEYKARYGGKASMAPELFWFQAGNEADEDLAELTRQYHIGLYSHPIYSEKGGWPSSIKKVIDDYGFKLGYHRERLPSFTDEEIQLVKGTYDFYALNYYTSRFVRKALPGEGGIWFVNAAPDIGAMLDVDPVLPAGSESLFAIFPEGIRRIISWLKRQYGPLDVLVTENGHTTMDSRLQDDERILFIRDHLEQLQLAIKEDKVNVIGYSYWSMMDVFEWGGGYTNRFGLYAVNFSDPLRTRTPRKSAYYYASLINSNRNRFTNKSTVLSNYNKNRIPTMF